MRIQNKILLSTFFLILFLSFVSASIEDTSFDFKTNNPGNINLKCFDNNFNLCNMNSTICYLSSSSSNGTILIDNETMIKSGSYFIYNFTSSQNSVNDIYSDVVSCIGATSSITTFTHQVMPNGKSINVPNNNLYLILIVVFIFMILFFLFIGYLYENKYVRIPSVVLAGLTTVVLFGLSLTIVETYLPGETQVLSYFNMFYYLLVALSGVMIIGLIIWLTVSAFDSFNRMRGLKEDEDFD